MRCQHHRCFGAACLAQVQRPRPPLCPSAKHPPAWAQLEMLLASSGGEGDPVTMPAGSMLPVPGTAKALGAMSPATGDKSVISTRANHSRVGPDLVSAPSSAKLRQGEGGQAGLFGTRRVLCVLGLGRGPGRQRVQAGAGRERVPGRAGSQLGRRAAAGHSQEAGTTLQPARSDGEGV